MDKEEIGRRIRICREAYQERIGRKFSQADLAEKCGWENGAGRISNYENGSREPSISDLEMIAHSMDYTLKELLFAKNTFQQSKRPVTIREPVPILTIDQVKDWLENPILTPNYRTTYMYLATDSVGKNAFFLRIEGDAMVSSDNLKISYFDGHYALIDPDKEYEIGNDVLVEIENNILLRHLTRDGTRLILQAQNPKYPNIDFSEMTKVLGVVLLTQRIVSASELTHVAHSS